MKVTDGVLDQISHLKSLKLLVLGDCNEVTDIGVKSLSKIRFLQVLTLTGGDKITDVGLQPFSGHAFLQHLNLSESSKIRNDGFRTLSSCLLLTHLYLGSYSVTDDGLESLAPLKNLRVLGLSRYDDTTALGRDQIEARGCVIRSKESLFLSNSR
jgi:F-box and leucine-rich repeat protein 14